MSKPKKAELQELEKKLRGMVWYNRSHNYTQEALEKLAKDHPDIFNGRLRAQKITEFESPEVLEGWDDFEWGMLNGRLAMLRYILWGEWEDLST